MTGLLRLDGGEATLLVAVEPARGPLILHWGERLPATLPMAGLTSLRDRAAPHAALDVVSNDNTLLPTEGLGLFGYPAIAGSRDAGSWTTSFGGWQEQDRRLSATDPVSGLAVDLELALDETGVLASRTSLRNTGEDAYRLDWLAALCLTLPEDCTELLAFTGHWGDEWRTSRESLGAGTWLCENRRGRTSHDRFPAIVVGTPGFSAGDGRVWGFHLGWSGNHRLLVEPLGDGGRRVQLGELLAPSELTLAPGGSATTPWAFASFSAAGLDGLTRRHHAHVRRHVVHWPRAAVRPVILNTWEANYFDHDEERLKRQATKAAELGVERFVVDDGWFRARNGPQAGLGDWTPDRAKYPNGLAPLARHVAGLGMEFGLWVEPEMVSPKSDIFRDHEDWVLRLDRRAQITGRHQLVLDLTRREVGDHLFTALDRLLGETPIAYLKWDMNRNLATAGDASGRPAFRAQTLAFYALLDRLRAAHPAVEIESCASGGGRADWGVLARTQRIWVSDCTDALERQRIQRGFSLFFPPEVMGAHVSTIPNHQTARRASLGFRAITALFGHLGLELDPLALTPEEAGELKAWIALHKRLRPLLHAGDAFRQGGVSGRWVHGVIAPDRRQAVVAVVQETAQEHRYPPPMRLPGLDPGLSYALGLPAPQRLDFYRPAPAHEALARGELEVAGAALQAIGFTLPELPPESALLIELHAVEE